MFVRNAIQISAIVRDSAWVIGLSAVWSFLVVLVHDILDYDMIALPQTPVSTIGIVVSLYLGFKTTSAYNRWWEARKIWGAIVNSSRTWANQVFVLVDYDSDNKERLTNLLVRRHIAWVIALAYQLRKSSRLVVSHGAHVFDGRSPGLEDFHTAKPEHYEAFLPETEREALREYANPATQIIRRQGDDLRALFDAGKVDNNRFVSLMNTLGDLYDWQGKCERIKNTPFPRQITYFGRSFAWIFIFLLPLSFVEFFSQEAAEHQLSGWAEHEYVLMLVPFTVLVSLIFFLIEKVSESCEDPFEWGTTDVPIAALSRVIEIDLRQMLGDTDVPGPIAPRNGVVY